MACPAAALPRAAFADTGIAQDALSRALPAMEERLGARLGVHVVDTHTGRPWAHRADECLPIVSPFKLLACAAVLARVDARAEDPARRIRFQAGHHVTYSPVTRLHASGLGVHLGERREATMTR